MKEKSHYVRKWIVPVALMIAVFSLTPTYILTNSATATIDVQARQKAVAVMNLIDQSLGYYANATGSAYVERAGLPSNPPSVNMTALANATAQPIVSQADYQIAQGLADKALVTFMKTAPLTHSNNNPQTILSALSGLIAFKTAVDNSAPYNTVEDIMLSPIDRDMEKAFQTS